MWLARRRLKYDAHCCTNDLQFAALLPVHSPPPEGIVQSFCPGALGTRYFKLRIQHRPLPRPISHTHKLVTHTIHTSLFSDPCKTTAGGTASGWLWFKNNRYNRDSRAIPNRRDDGERWPAERENFSLTWVGPSNPWEKISRLMAFRSTETRSSSFCLSRLLHREKSACPRRNSSFYWRYRS